MKKINKIFIILIVAFIMLTCLVACNGSELKLFAPENIAINGSTLSWGEVENAQGYEVVIDDNEAIDVKTTYVDIAITELRTYNIKVRAYAINEDKKVYSEYGKIEHVVDEKMPSPLVTINNKNASWPAIEGASGYEVTVKDSQDKILYKDIISATQFSFDETGVAEENRKYNKVGRYLLTIATIPDENNTSFARSSEVSAYYCVTKKLETPVISGISTTSIRWDAVSGSSGYKVSVYFDDKDDTVEDELITQATTTANSYSIYSIDFDKKGIGSYYCLVQALGDTGNAKVYLDSDISKRIRSNDLIVLPKPDTSKFNIDKGLDGKTYLEIELDSIYMLRSISINLRAATADGKTALSSLNKETQIEDGELSYALETATYPIDNVRYYVDKTRYVINKDPFDATKTYYRKGASDSYVEQTGLTAFVPDVDYYVQETYKALAYGPDKFYPVVEGEKFDGRKVYYTEQNPGDYVVEYDLQEFAKGVQYFVKEPSELEEFEDGVDYYYLEYAKYTILLDDLFLEEKDGKLFAKKTNDAYYGKIFDVTAALIGEENRVVSTSSIECNGFYLSYKKPEKITSETTFANSEVAEKYFTNKEAQFNELISKYQDYYAIGCLGELQYIPKEPGAKYVLVTDIDAAGYTWYPIGSLTSDGIIDGNFKKISNLVYASQAKVNNYALILENNGTIKNLFLVDVATNFTDKKDACLAGLTIKNNGTIDGCYVSGALKDYTEVAGIVVENNGTIVRSQNYASIAAITYAAGIAVKNNNTIKYSYNKAPITARGDYIPVGNYDAVEEYSALYPDQEYYYYSDTEGKYKHIGTIVNTGLFVDDKGEYYPKYYRKMNEKAYAGGLVALNNDLSKIENSYSISNVSAEAQKEAVAGGLVANASENSNVINCYSGSKFSFNASNREVVKAQVLSTNSSIVAAGGLIGINKGSISYSYSTSRAVATNNFGGFVGINEGNISYCYSTGGTSSQSGTKGPFVGLLTETTGQILENNYYYNPMETEYWNSEQDSVATRVDNLRVLKENLTGLEPPVYVSMDEHLEPVLMEHLYALDYNVTIKPNQEITQHATIYVAASATKLEDDSNIVIVGRKDVSGTALAVVTVDDTRLIMTVTIK